ncbi:MAG: 30S ribosomal protein S6 [Patescibacteria group bacterium]
MRDYEVFYILTPSLEEEAVDAAVSRYEETITKLGGTITKTDKWGKRRLAYEIKDQPEGFYVLTTFQAPNEASQELDRLMRIADEVLRHLIVRLDED